MSSLRSLSSPTYHTSVEQKLHSQNAARQRKNQFGSPKLRDLLREKCKVRVREARQASFDGSRDISYSGENTLVSKILRQELADLESNLNLQELIYKELIGEMNMWYADQIEEEEDYLIEVGDTSIVFCPVCQKAAIKQSVGRQMICECGAVGNLQSLNAAVQKAICHHEIQCSQLLHFFVEQISNGNQKNLNALCENCDYFVSLT